MGRIANGFSADGVLANHRAWIPVGDLMGLPVLFEAIGPEAAPVARWMEKARAELARPAAPG